MLTDTQAKVLQMFSDLSFDSQRHLYFWKGYPVPYSVTGLVKQFVPKFNADKVIYNGKSIADLSAAKQSRETGVYVSAHELKRKWQLINSTACELGTKVHKFMENYTGLETPTLPQEVAGIKYIQSLKGQYAISFRELRAYSQEFNFAGTMDIPLQVLGNDIEQFVIDDYKTTGDLFKAYDYMLEPFTYLESSAYNHYQIQLSLYQVMLEEVGVNIVNRRLVHLKADGEFEINPLWDFSGMLKDYLRSKKMKAA